MTILRNYITLSKWLAKINAKQERQPLSLRRAQSLAQQGRIEKCELLSGYYVHKDSPDPRYSGPGRPKERG